MGDFKKRIIRLGTTEKSVVEEGEGRREEHLAIFERLVHLHSKQQLSTH